MHHAKPQMLEADQRRPPSGGASPQIAGAAERLFPLIAVALLVLFALLAWATRPGGVDMDQDDAIYIFLARSLLDLGYHDIYRVDLPIHNMYPPAYPAALALLVSVFGERLALFQAMGIAAVVGGLALFGDAVRRLWSPVLALLCLATLVVNPHLVLLGGKIGTDGLYLLLSMTALWLLVDERQTPRTRTAVAVAVAAAAIGAALTRSVGVTLLAGVGAYWLLQRRVGTALRFAVASAATVGLWLYWTTVSPEQYVGRSYIADAGFAGVGPARPFSLVLVDRALDNVPRYLSFLLPNRIGVPRLPGPPIVDYAVAAGMAVAVAVGLVVVWRKWRPATLYLLAYAALLALWPWALGRFLNVLVPLLVMSFLLGVGATASRLGNRWRVPATVAAATLLFLVCSVRTVKAVRESGSCDADPRAAPAECRVGHKGAFFNALEQVERVAPADAVILSGKPAPAYYFTERQTLPFYPALSLDPDGLLRMMQAYPTTYVILGWLNPSEHSTLVHLLEPNCRSLELVSAFDPHTYVVRVLGPGAVSRDNAACDALAAYRDAEQPTTATMD